VEHVLPLFDEELDDRLKNAILVAKEWEKGNATVGDARNAAFGIIVLAKEISNPTSLAIVRATRQAVATAHTADHSLGAVVYALKAVKSAGKSIDTERKWQNEQLPSEIREIVLASRNGI
jgi:hypothetical protein